ncbi:Clavaminate synthase-like protein [Lactarius vividus]|nr:Clavaminate synthase-like protein [Lactarius vividus]
MHSYRPETSTKSTVSGKLLLSWVFGSHLKNHGTDAEVDAMFEMGAHTMALPLEEKMRFKRGDGGDSFGYKFAGSNGTDPSGALDSVEHIIVSQDDALAFPTVVHRGYPRTVEERMDSAVRPFVRKSMETNQTIMNVLNDRLGLPPGYLAELHAPEEYSESEVNCLKKTAPSTPEPPNRASIGAHTDYGSLSLLHNRLGGLQFLLPNTDEWKYAKVGQFRIRFSAGIFHPNLHRVVLKPDLASWVPIGRPPPKAQAPFDRWSLVYFACPRNSVPLAPLTKESTLIAEAAARAPEGRYVTGSTAGEWYRRRVRNQLIKHQKGTETWMASRGTEHAEVY